jgi:hypothetical protein
MNEKLHPAAFWIPVGVLAALALFTLVPLTVFVISLYLKAGAPPPIARDKQMHFGVPSAEWTTVLQTKFPIGTPHSMIVTTLTYEGFKVEPSPVFPHRFIATYGWGSGFPCVYALSAEWFVDASDKLESIGGNYTNACL